MIWLSEREAITVNLPSYTLTHVTQPIPSYDRFLSEGHSSFHFFSTVRNECKNMSDRVNVMKGTDRMRGVSWAGSE